RIGTRDRAPRFDHRSPGSLASLTSRLLGAMPRNALGGGHRPGSDTSGRGAYIVRAGRGRQSFLMSKRTKIYKQRQKVRDPVNPYAGPPKAELRKQVEAAMASGVPVTRCPAEKKTPKPRHSPRVAAQTVQEAPEIEPDAV